MAHPYLNAPLVKMESAVIPRAESGADDETRGPTFMALFDSATVTRAETATETPAEGATMNGATMAVQDVPLTETHDAIQLNEPMIEPPTDLPAGDDASKSPLPTDQPPTHPPSTQPPKLLVPSASTSTLPLRTRSSCTNCRQRKQRCDHGAPGEPCRGCVKGGKVCVYPGGLPLSAGGSGMGKKQGEGKGKKSARWKGDAECESSCYFCRVLCMCR